MFDFIRWTRRTSDLGLLAEVAGFLFLSWELFQYVSRNEVGKHAAEPGC